MRHIIYTLLLLTTIATAESVYSDGIEYKSYQKFPLAKFHVLKIDLTNKNLTIINSAYKERGLTPSIHDNSYSAYATVNANFFTETFNTRGLTISDGEKWPNSQKMKTTPFLACTIRNICTINHKLPKDLNDSWQTAVAGTPSILKAGVVRKKETDIKCGSFCSKPHPRTAVGLSKSGKIMFLVVAEGRRPLLPGITLSRLSEFMNEIGAYNAINLDGGGSSTMIFNGKRVSKRPINEPGERKVSNSIMIVER